MTAADDRPLNPDLWDSDGNLLVPRHGIRIAMGLALVAAGAYWLFVSNLIFSASSIWIVVSAFRIAYKAGWGMFFLTLAATLVGMTLAYRLLGGH